MIPTYGNNAPANPEMQWRHLAFLGFSNYAVSDQPWIVNLTTGYLMDGYLNNAGYVTICLIHDDGRAVTHKMHRIVAKAFHGVPIDKNLTPDHINRNKSDNRPANLRWATKAEQRANQDRPLYTKGRMVTQMFPNGFEIVTWFSVEEASRQTGIASFRIRRALNSNKQTDGYMWKDGYGYLEGEIWLPANLANYETGYVSNKGRYCNSKFLVTYGSDNGGGYRTVSIATIKCKRKYILMHRLVALVFIGPDDRFVNHKNGNKHDNRPENLEYVTQAENNDHAAKTGLIHYKLNGKTSKRVKQMTLDYRILAIYPSIAEAHRQTGINMENISRICHRRDLNATVGGKFHWAYASSNEIADESLKNVSKMVNFDDIKGGRPKAVEQYELDGTFAARYESTMAAQRATGITNGNICSVCNGKSKTAGGFFWKRPSKLNPNTPILQLNVL